MAGCIISMDATCWAKGGCNIRLCSSPGRTAAAWWGVSQVLGTAAVHARRAGAGCTEQCCQSGHTATPGGLRTGGGSCIQAGTGGSATAAATLESGM